MIQQLVREKVEKVPILFYDIPSGHDDCTKLRTPLSREAKSK